MSIRILIACLLAASAAAVIGGDALAAAALVEDTGSGADVGYCEKGKPETKCYTYGCRASRPGEQAVCGWYVCRVWTGSGCLL